MQIGHNYSYVISLSSLPPISLSHPIWVITEHQAGLLVLYSNVSSATLEKETIWVNNKEQAHWIVL